MDWKKITEALVTAKAVQYIMIAILLLAAFFLPRMEGARQTNADNAAVAEFDSEILQWSESGNAASGIEGASQKSGNAVSRAGEVNNESGDAVSGVGEASQKSGNAGSDAGEANNDSGNAVQGSKGIIVLDPGHGGDDPGMIGGSGISEKTLNLIYAEKLKELLEQQGYEVILTRESENGLYDAESSHKKAQDMQRRVEVIAEYQPLVTVSIHQNSYQDPEVSGPQVFYYEHSEQGKQLANIIQNHLNQELTEARSRVEKGNGSYYILKRSKGTTVIVECGFLSNPEEEARLQEAAYQDRVAQAICSGVLEYLNAQL